MRAQRTLSRTNAVVCKNNIRIPIFTKRGNKKQGDKKQGDLVATLSCMV